MSQQDPLLRLHSKEDFAFYQNQFVEWDLLFDQATDLLQSLTSLQSAVKNQKELKSLVESEVARRV